MDEFILLNSDITDSELFRMPRVFSVWLHIALNTQGKATTIRGVKVGQFQCLMSVRKIAGGISMSPSKVEEYIQTLVNLGEIEVKPVYGELLITVLKHIKYN